MNNNPDSFGITMMLCDMIGGAFFLFIGSARNRWVNKRYAQKQRRNRIQQLKNN
jgi:hypothetical protein